MKASAIVADGTFSCMTAPLQGDYEKIFHEAVEIGYDAGSADTESAGRG